jgi:hypothetical protein
MRCIKENRGRDNDVAATNAAQGYRFKASRKTIIGNTL